MMNITLICVGRLKEDYLRSACEEYEKRLGAFCRFSTEVIEPERLPDDPSDSQIQAALEKEGERILKKIPSGAYVITMCIEGKKMTSPQLAETMDKLPNLGFGTAVFVIGSSYGLCGRVKDASALRLSMSEMTFPHQLARVMLLEQIYRAYSILGNRRYHK